MSGGISESQQKLTQLRTRLRTQMEQQEAAKNNANSHTPVIDKTPVSEEPIMSVDDAPSMLESLARGGGGGASAIKRSASQDEQQQSIHDDAVIRPPSSTDIVLECDSFLSGKPVANVVVEEDKSAVEPEKGGNEDEVHEDSFLTHDLIEVKLEQELDPLQPEQREGMQLIAGETETTDNLNAVLGKDEPNLVPEPETERNP